MKIVNDLTGKRFGRLVVEGYAGRRQYQHNYINQWNCVCDCGKRCLRVQRALLDPHVSSCGCQVRERMAARPDAGNGSVNGLMCAYRIGAKNRGHEFALTKTEFRELTSSDCYYCGASPQQVITNGKCAPYTYNGVDRVDNERGYTSDNVRPCCGHCNTAKMALKESDFFAWVERVCARQKGRE